MKYDVGDIVKYITNNPSFHGIKYAVVIQHDGTIKEFYAGKNGSVDETLDYLNEYTDDQYELYTNIFTEN